MRDYVVVGAGIVGLATARALLQFEPGSDVLVLDKADDVATAQTGHNSGVVHSGIYYRPGSQKARLCRAGREATEEFCKRHGIAYKNLGKLVVAVDPAEGMRMEQIFERASASRIAVKRVGISELSELEPQIRGVAGLLCPDTSIVDFRQIARAMAQDVAEMGGRVVTRSEVHSINESTSAHGRYLEVESDSGCVQTRRLIACAGLQADRLARMGGLEVNFRIVPFRGEYYQLPSTQNKLVGRLIYPVPDPNLPFLGVHLSPTVDQRITVGPNAVLGLSREGYSRRSFNSKDVASYASFPGMWKFLRGNLKAGASELRSSMVKQRYLRKVQRYCPELQLEDLRPFPAGIRAQAVLDNGALQDDFLFRETHNQLHVCNAPSPAATAAIPIAERIAKRIVGRE